MKSGKRPDGTLVDEAMPWQATTAMWSDEDLNAVWAYLRTLESKPTPE